MKHWTEKMHEDKYGPPEKKGWAFTFNLTGIFSAIGGLKRRMTHESNADEDGTTNPDGYGRRDDHGEEP